ncbi:[FeFe] hydrogenase H-cluster radical SAM maturase HydE [Brachyspira innocens]|uniref:[FeFe] hydrogenase H-cluster radical SAM maturase HydE n=1 Tax=Brachyspira innocens TaxID=13264 RepID=A0ABT8YY13_9SPIR|nr:[FeFe] hydrogenase H-cluster radical SAM maturase HydE [Brachyspira innocens]MDO6992986.1 [FeFe] hydrogenase H-cluster radical SAM maturase HydE [Brachyspira innocens]MDO7020767.1 [FeFe] hydrogenase H-cluster radical SAM maturase HydE [Brachyspira innocens]
MIDINKAKEIINKIDKEESISYDDALFLLSSFEYDNNINKKQLTHKEEESVKELKEYLRVKAREKADKIFGKYVFMRGLIEFTNYCKNDCIYCGIRKSNKNAERYRLSKEDILSCCELGYEIGFRTFVLQGGEDPYYNINIMSDIVEAIKNKFPDCALTLSIGEKEEEYYRVLKEKGADRFLLRHETSDNTHYSKLHPMEMSLNNRKECLRNLKKLGFQTGTGIMVGSPYQTLENIADDLVFMQEIKPEMIGIGPFLPHKDTPFANEKKGELELTLILISILRLIFPLALIPATTALGTIKEGGRELGILHGSNVVMPNLSPMDVRKKYLLYNDKISTGTESAEGVESLKNNMKNIGYILTGMRGDYDINRGKK